METERTANLGLEADLPGVPCPPQLNRWLEALSDDLLSILETFANDGHGVWLVGGCVRDAWLGEDAQDIDLCTSCPPERMLALFGDQAIATGVEFGTVTLKGTPPLRGHHLRTESLYRDGRRPEHVAWGSSLKEDLSRRDFTFNSMAVDVARRLLYDPYDGVTDMEQRVVRAVGDAGLRCREDALRILRAYRFLNRDQGPLWTMELRLQNAVREHRERLKMVAVEWHWMELEKILTTPLSGRVLAKMNEDGVFETVFGEGQRPRNSLLLLNDLPTLGSYAARTPCTDDGRVATKIGGPSAESFKPKRSCATPLCFTSVGALLLRAKPNHGLCTCAGRLCSGPPWNPKEPEPCCRYDSRKTNAQRGIGGGAHRLGKLACAKNPRELLGGRPLDHGSNRC